MKYPLEKDDWKRIWENNLTIALNVLYVKNEKIYPAYISKYNSNREKRIILLTIPNAVKKYLRYLEE